MSDSKYTDEQIIKALEARMPHDEVSREAYDLIKRQREEIKKLKRELRMTCPWCGQLRR